MGKVATLSEKLQQVQQANEGNQKCFRDTNAQLLKQLQRIQTENSSLQDAVEQLKVPKRKANKNSRPNSELVKSPPRPDKLIGGLPKFGGDGLDTSVQYQDEQGIKRLDTGKNLFADEDIKL